MLNRKITSVLLAVFLLVLGSAAYALPPKVSWSPAALNLPSLRPGESTTIKVVLTNTSLLKSQRIGGGGLAFKVTNGAGTLITASASFPNNIEPGQKVNVTLTLSVASTTSALPPRVIAGRVQLVKRETVNGKVEETIFDKPLAVNFTVSPIPLPPDPGEEGKATVAGIDIGGGPNGEPNGVRDDIDRYIVFTHPDSAKKQEALKQNAREIQAFLMNADDKEKSIVNSHQTGGLRCAQYVFGDMEVATPFRRALKSQILNTDSRSKAYLKFDAWLGGQVYGLHEPVGKAACTFNPDSLPN